MKVILDTNIYVNDFKMTSGKFDIFFKYSKAIPFDVCLPEVVYDEILTKYRERLIDEWTILEKKSQIISQLLISPLLSATHLDIDEAVKCYKEYLDSKIKSEKIQLLKYPKVEHKSIVRAILNREKPFKENGNGYRDKLILETLKERFAYPEETIVFISNNIRDFGKEPSFDEEIQKQLTNITHWQLKNSLQSFIDEYIAPLSQYGNAVDSKIHKAISEFILSKQFMRMLNWKDVGYDVADLERDYGFVAVSQFDNIKSIEVNKFALPNTNWYKVKVTGNFLVYASGRTSDFLNSQSWREYFDYKNEEGDCSISGQQRYYVELYLLIKIDNDQICDAELKHLETNCGKYDYDW